MHIEVDCDLCQGHGVCESEAPDVFRVSKDTNQVEVLDTNPPESLRGAVIEGVKNCPTQALKIVED